uniref:Uncharacterized protein n=1 Tax=Triticum urartu TaxID=4572 RepID=A0A8R7TBI2_TRIUA
MQTTTEAHRMSLNGTVFYQSDRAAAKAMMKVH